MKIYKNSQLGLPTFVVTSILSGDENSPNKTADFAELVVDCRLTPELEEVFEQVMSELAVQYHFTHEDIVTPVLSTLTDNQAPFIQLLTNLSGAKTTAASGSNDQGFFENVGIRTVVFGPGQHEQCHIANESIILEKLEEHIEILQSFIKKMQES